MGESTDGDGAAQYIRWKHCLKVKGTNEGDELK